VSEPGRQARLRAAIVRALPVLRAIGFLAAVVIVVAMAVIAVREVPARDLNPWPLGPALLAAVGWYALLACGWAVFASGRVTRYDVSTWCRTQVLRYLPGGIWAPASRVAAVRGRPADRLVTVAAENVTVLCAALAVGGVALAASGEPAWLCLVALLALPRMAARFTGGRTRVGARRTVLATADYAVAFVAYAACAVLVQRAVTGDGDPLQIAGAAAVAWGAGLVVIIAPGGVGVRELAYVALLSDSLARADLAAAALTMRAVTVVAELAVLLAAGRPRGASAPGSQPHLLR
jgi:glycosyltransferase 2 family protein